MTDRWGSQPILARPLSGREIAVEAPPEVLAAMRAKTAQWYGMAIPDDAIVFRNGGRLSASSPGFYVALKRGDGHLNPEVPDGRDMLRAAAAS